MPRRNSPPPSFLAAFLRASVVGAIAAALAGAAAAQSQPAVLSVAISGHRYIGEVLASDATTITLLRPDGSMNSFGRAQIERLQRLERAFRPYSSEQLETRLLRELPSRYTVGITEHYVVAYPRAADGAWATRFETLYRRFVHYFSARGLALAEPRFPLIAIVLQTRQEFEQYTRDHGVASSEGVVGYYFPDTNRVVTFDPTSEGGSIAEAGLQATLIHEAAHQAAFNTGIHDRCQVTPRWLSEGLATMFEAPGVHHSSEHPALDDRLNVVFHQALPERLARQAHLGSLPQLVANDDWFRSDPMTAYTLAWAWTAFLAETRFDEYRQYLARVARQAAFTEYPAEQRIADFSAAFGSDLRELEHRFELFFTEHAAEPR